MAGDEPGLGTVPETGMGTRKHHGSLDRDRGNVCDGTARGRQARHGRRLRNLRPRQPALPERTADRHRQGPGLRGAVTQNRQHRRFGGERSSPCPVGSSPCNAGHVVDPTPARGTHHQPDGRDRGHRINLRHHDDRDGGGDRDACGRASRHGSRRPGKHHDHGAGDRNGNRRHLHRKPEPHHPDRCRDRDHGHLDCPRSPEHGQHRHQRHHGEFLRYDGKHQHHRRREPHARLRRDDLDP